MGRCSCRRWGDVVVAQHPAVEKLITAIQEGLDITTAEPETQKIEGLFAALRTAAWDNIRSKYKGAELEQLVRRLFERIYAGGRVEHWGGPGEKGADLIVFTHDPLGLEYKIAVQVKLHDGTHDDPHALEQIKKARKHHQVDGGVIITTAVETSKSFDEKRAALEAELAIDIRVITRNEFVELLIAHLGGDREL